MDAAQHFQHQHRVSQERAQQDDVGQGAGVAREAGVHQRSVRVQHADRQRYLVARRRHLELVGQVHVHERRDVEALGADLADHTAGLDPANDRHQIGVAPSEGVVHLVQDRSERPVRPVAEVQAQGIEHLSEHRGHAQQADSSARFNPRLGETLLDLRLQRLTVARQMMVWRDREDAEAGAGEELQPTFQHLHLVEIDQQHRNALAKGVPKRPQARVGNHAAIQARGDRAHAARLSVAADVGRG